MSSDASRNTERTAMEIAEHCPLSEEGGALLDADVASGKYIAQLIAQGQYEDALRFTAFDLPKRESVWWGVLCLWEALRTKHEELPGPINSVLQSLIVWLRDPSEVNRRAVENAGQSAGMTTPPGQLAMAAFYSEGSMSLPGQPEVNPEPWLTAKNVASVVLAASRMGKPSETQTAQRLFLVLAAELTKGQLPWNVADEAELASSAP